MKKHFLLFLVLAGLTVTGFSQVRMPEKPEKPANIDYMVKETGYWIGAYANCFYATNGQHQAIASQFDIVNGYRFSEFLKVGLGIAPRYYFTKNLDLCGKNGSAVTVPIYADVRGNIIPQEDAMFAFFWSADLGYTINEGIYASPFIGIRRGDIRHNFIAGITYILQGHSSVTDHTDPIHLVGLRLGYEF